MTADRQIVFAGVDGLDVTFQGRIPPALCAVLERAKDEAQAEQAPVLTTYGEWEFHVAETGAPGGYRFRCDDGDAIWFISPNQQPDRWNVRVSCKSVALLTHGLQGMWARLELVLKAIKADIRGHAIGRVDYAVDMYDPAFVLDPLCMVMHSHAIRRDVPDAPDPGVRIAGVSSRYTSVTCGTMPGRQVCVYDKSREAVARQKAWWWDVWGLAPKTKGVWRVEARFGKEALRDRYGVHTYEDMIQGLVAMVRDLLSSDIRMSVDNGDPNRARWPMHPLWADVIAAVSLAADGAMAPSSVREIRREQLASTVAAMMRGLSATYAVAHGLEGAEIYRIADIVRDKIAAYLQLDFQEYLAKMRRSERKYHFIITEDVDDG